MKGQGTARASFIRKQITIIRTAAKHLLKAPPPITVRAGISAYEVGVGNEHSGHSGDRKTKRKEETPVIERQPLALVKTTLLRLSILATQTSNFPFLSKLF